MKLLYTNFHSGSGGGHTTYIRELARELADRHEVHVAAPPGSRLLLEAAAIPGVHTLAQPFPNGLRRLRERAAAVRQLHEYLRTHRFDIVHVNGSADHRITIAALRGISPRPRLVLTKHNTKPMSGLQHVWRARFHTDKVIAVCDYVCRQVQATPYRVCQPETVYNGVDTHYYAPFTDAGARAQRSRFTRDADALLIGSNAGTADYKSWTDMAGAMVLLNDDERRRVHVMVAGLPPAEHQLAIVRAAGLEAQFHFPGMLEDVRPVVAALDAGFVISHATEAISFACREMMSMAKPVMVTDYSGLPENVRQGVDGWLVPVHGHAEMAETLRWMLQNRDALPQMGAAAHEHAVKEFGMALFIDRILAVYEKLLADKPRQ
ncbi:D-inositol-3-phosphate glycosyltransferase [compost metagenome]